MCMCSLCCIVPASMGLLCDINVVLLVHDCDVLMMVFQMVGVALISMRAQAACEELSKTYCYMTFPSSSTQH